MHANKFKRETQHLVKGNESIQYIVTDLLQVQNCDVFVNDENDDITATKDEKEIDARYCTRYLSLIGSTVFFACMGLEPFFLLSS